MGRSLKLLKHGEKSSESQLISTDEFQYHGFIAFYNLIVAIAAAVTHSIDRGLTERTHTGSKYY